MTTILGIESTAHTFGIGIVKNRKILANVRDMYVTEKGGIIPIESAKHHAKISHELYKKALEVSGIKEKEIDAIAFSQGPGLAPCLIEGIKFAKEISLKLKKPLVGVNHCVAHIEIGKTTGAKDPVMLYASGANTQVIAYASGKYRVFGETLDIGVGNFIDNFARYSGIGFPGGPAIEKLAKNGKNFIELPYKVKGMDITLSGILTNLKQKVESKKYPIEDLAYSLQETVFSMLVETAERALAHTGKNELLLGGGVACNSRLQEMCKIMCKERTSSFSGSSKSQTKERGAKFFCPERSLLVDNGSMIAFLGEIMFKSKSNVFSVEQIENADIHPTDRTDDIEVNWKC